MTHLFDDPALQAPEFSGRVSRRYLPGHWIGGVHRAFAAISEVGAEGDPAAVDSHPPHYLAALWKPPSFGTPFVPRWPLKVNLVAPDVAAGLRDLLAEIPSGDHLWLTEQHIDWSLMAQIVLLGEPGLRPFQQLGLQALAQAEREVTLAAIRLHYGAPLVR
jgi:hypothetical protein